MYSISTCYPPVLRRTALGRFALGLCAVRSDRACATPSPHALCPHELMTGEPADQPFHFQDAEGGHDLTDGEPGAADQLVDRRGMVVEVAEERRAPGRRAPARPGAARGARPGRSGLRGPGGRALRGCRRRSRRAWRRRGSGDGSPRLLRLSTGPGTAKTSRFCSIACRAVESEPLRGVASTTTTPRLRPGDDPVALGEQAGQRDLAHRHLAEQSAGLGQGAGQVLVLGRIDLGEPVGQHGDAAAPGLDRPAVGGGVDPPGQARDDRQADARQSGRPAARRSVARRACIAASRPARWPAGRGARAGPCT